MKTLSGLKAKNGLLGAWLSNKENVISLVRWRKIRAPPLPKKYNVRSLDFHFSALSLSHGEINGK